MIRAFLVQEKMIFDGGKKGKTDVNRINIKEKNACVAVKNG